MKRTIGIISANYTDDDFGELTAKRCIASLPYAGRYRLIDFALSDMVNSGIDTIGLITPYNYRSIVDHVGVGRSWGLGRKIGGLFMLPGVVYGMKTKSGKFLLRDIVKNIRFLLRDNAENVVLMSSNMLYNMNLRPMIEAHEKSAANITMAYSRIEDTDICRTRTGVFLDMNGNGRVESMHYVTKNPEYSHNYFIDCMVITKKFLVNLAEWFESVDYLDIPEIIARNLDTINAYGYEFNGHTECIENLEDYRTANMNLLDRNLRHDMFFRNHPILTKIQDVCPAKYTDTARIRNSIVSDGCIIEGEVENSIIFRSTHVGKGTVIRDSIIMQHCSFGTDCRISNIISDKYVTVHSGAVLEGGTRPMIIEKNKEI